MPILKTNTAQAGFASEAEGLVYKALTTALPQGALIWHDLRVEIPGPLYGQGDFVVTQPGQGVLVVKINAGLVENIDGRWYHQQKEMLSSPADQAHGFSSKLRFALRQHGIEPPATLALAWCPESTSDAAIDSQNLKNIIAGHKHLTDAATWLPALFEKMANGPTVNPVVIAALDKLWQAGQSLPLG